MARSLIESYNSELVYLREAINSLSSCRHISLETNTDEQYEHNLAFCLSVLRQRERLLDRTRDDALLELGRTISR